MNKTKISHFKDYNDNDFENLLNIETIPYVSTFSNHHANRYEPTVYQDLISLIEQTYKDFHSDSHFIDFGSGLMRVPILFNHLLNISVTGIELNKQLYLLGLKNIKNYQLLHHPSSIHTLNINAIHYQFQGNETHLFFFNPFSVFVFQKVMENLMTTDIKECDIILYYVKPEYEMYLSECIQFKLKYSILLDNESIDPSEKINIYQYTKT